VGKQHTTGEVAEAIGATEQTVRRWTKLGLLPTPERVHRGGRGVTSLYPGHTLAQARWVLDQLENENLPIPRVLAALQAGAFKPPEEP